MTRADKQALLDDMRQQSITSQIEVQTKMRTRAQAEAAQMDQEWRDMISGALQEGYSASDIAEAAGVSRQRVYQIRDGKR